MSEFAAGWIGGCCGILLGHPFDTLKVRQQALNHTSIVYTFKNCIQQDGVRSLLRGLSYPIYSVGAINSIFFGVYNRVLDKISPRSSEGKKDYEAYGIKYLDVFAAGCIAGFAQLSLAVPVDLVKVRLQAHQGRYRGPFDCLKQIHNEQGLRGCYRGFIPQAFRDIKASGIYFVIYHMSLDAMARNRSRTQSNFSNNQKVTDNSAAEIFIAGGLAGLISWQAIIYLDVLKSRIQADNVHQPRYKGILDCICQSYKQDGIRVFFRGFTLMSLRAFPLNGATFLGYEYSMKIFQQMSF